MKNINTKYDRQHKCGLENHKYKILKEGKEL